MKPIQIIASIASVALIGQTLSGALIAQAQSTPASTAPKYIVVLHDSTSNVPAVANEMARQHGLQLGHTYSTALKGFASSMSLGKLSALRNDPRVKFVSADEKISIAAPKSDNPNKGKGKPTPTPTPTPTPEPTPTPTPISTQTLPTGVDRIESDLNTTNSALGVSVAVIDSGVDLGHPDLQSRIVAQKSCVSYTSSAHDDNGHGTHVAGTIAAADNYEGVVGVAAQAGIAAVKVLDSNGSGYWSDVICGIDWVTANAKNYNIVAANMSLSGSGSSDNNCGLSNNDALHRAICNSTGAGLTYVVAAGNNGADASTRVPAAYNDTVITVSALADSDGKSGGMGSSTSFGADDTFASFSNYGSVVDIGAPGVNINSTIPGGYGLKSGTSMASPHVAGAAAMYLSANPGATWNDVRVGLLSVAEVLGNGHTDPSGLHPEPVLQVNSL